MISESENALIRFTAHQFKSYLSDQHPEKLQHYISTQSDRSYHFWERRSRTFEVFNIGTAMQKLNYIHNNPLQEHWRQAESPEAYEFSSAAFYKGDVNRYSFLRDVREAF